MENMDKGLAVPKWVLIARPKIPQTPQNCLPNLSAQAQKFWISMKKYFIGVHSPCEKQSSFVVSFFKTCPENWDSRAPSVGTLLGWFF